MVQQWSPNEWFSHLSISLFPYWALPGHYLQYGWNIRRSCNRFAFTRYPLPLCYFTAKIVTKINLRITAKCHAYLQTLSKIPAKFENYLGKIVRGVAFTRYAVSICFGGGWTQKLLSSYCKKGYKNHSEDYSLTFCFSSDLNKNICNVSKHSA